MIGVALVAGACGRGLIDESEVALVIDPPELDLGIIPFGEVRRDVVEIQNTSSRGFSIMETTSDCACSTVLSSSGSIAPGQSAVIEATLHMKQRGELRKEAIIRGRFDGEQRLREVAFAIRAECAGQLKVEPMQIMVGTADSDISEIVRLHFYVGSEEIVPSPCIVEARLEGDPVKMECADISERLLTGGRIVTEVYDVCIPRAALRRTSVGELVLKLSGGTEAVVRVRRTKE